MKKLWSRSKSRVRGIQRGQEPAGAIDSSGSKANTPSHNAQAVPSVPAVPERSAMRLASSDSASRHGDSNRMQPTLIGISRPSATISRPGTAGSLQNAVDLAADKVAQTASLDQYRGHKRTKSPRYVDIFAVQDPASSKSSYNEDVAERNIDVKKVAEEEVQYRYVPSSKYQEEVASRNTHGYTKSADQFNYENLPPRQEAPRSQSAMGPGYYIPPDKIADADDIRRLHHAQLAALHQPKPHIGVNTAVQPLTAGQPTTQPAHPVIPSRGASQTAAVQRAQIPYETTQPSNVNPNSKKSSESRHQALEQRRQHNKKDQPLQPLTTSNVITVAPTLPGYQLSQSEVLQRKADPRNPGQPNDRLTNAAQRPDHPGRSMSLVSNASSVKKAINLQNRTIMDLTGGDEEVFSNGYPESDMSKSPVVEQAHVDAIRRVHPEVVSSAARMPLVKPDETGSQQKQAEEATTSAELSPVARQATPEVHQPSSFSSINTIVSVSPTIRLNGEPLQPSEPVLLPPSKSGSRGQSTKLYTVAETEPEMEVFETPAEEPAQFLQKSVPTTPAEKLTQEQAPSEQINGVAQPQSSPTSAETPKLSATTESTPKTIQMSPESLQSTDFIEPSRAFGVMARDFATTPSRPVQSGRSDREPNTSAKVTQHRNPVANGDTTRTVENFVPNSPPTSSSSTFDEDKFRRKQEQARAALVKLQQSLNDEFIPPPRTTRTVQDNTTRNRPLSNSSSTSNDGRPVNPTSIFSQVREHHTNGAQANGDIVQPRTSSHKHAVSAQDRPSSSTRPDSSASTATVKPIRRQRSPSTQKERELSSTLSEMRRLANEMRNPRLGAPPQSKSSIPQQTNSNRNSNSTTSTTSDVLPSPGEISLSSFPPPASVQHSRDTSLNLPIQNPADVTPPETARNSAIVQQKQNVQTGTQTPTPPPRYSQTQSPATSPLKAQPIAPAQQQRPAQAATQTQVPQSPGERRVLTRRGSNTSQASAKTSSSQFSIPYHMIPERGSSMRDSMVQEVDDED